MADRACAICAHLYDVADLHETDDYRLICDRCADAEMEERATRRNDGS